MKIPSILLVSGALLLTGCAHEYVIKLSNGSKILAASKPKLEGPAYHYKDAMGRDNSVPAGRVTVIEPQSSAKDDTRTFQAPTYKKPRHWYFLWLA